MIIQRVQCERARALAMRRACVRTHFVMHARTHCSERASISLAGKSIVHRKTGGPSAIAQCTQLCMHIHAAAAGSCVRACVCDISRTYAVCVCVCSVMISTIAHVRTRTQK